MVTIPFLNVNVDELAGDVATNPEFHTLITAIAIIGTALTFLAPIYYKRKSALARGLSETIRILESNKSHNARKMLYLKYQKNKEIDEEELKDSAEQVRNDLLMVQTMQREKAIASKAFHKLYSRKIFRTIENYFKFMEEFYPSHEVELPIKKLFQNSYRWHKREHKTSRELDAHLEDMWDKIGF